MCTNHNSDDFMCFIFALSIFFLSFFVSVCFVVYKAHCINET
jgi:hypothetical protein